MNLLNQFIDYLRVRKEGASHSTVKNYKADVKKFIVWFEEEFKKPFNPAAVTKEIISFSAPPLAARSVKRYVSSLRAFFRFLSSQGLTNKDPFETHKQSYQDEDPWRIKAFKNFLYNNNLSTTSIKNYIIDVRQFLTWAQSVTGIDEAWHIGSKNLLSKINQVLLAEYKERLLTASEFSIPSINRKLSVLKKYIAWGNAQGIMSSIPPHYFIHVNSRVSAKNSTAYHPFPPVALAQKTFKAIGIVFDALCISPLAKGAEEFEYHLGKLRKQSVFIQDPNRVYVPHISKELYAPLSISTTHYPFHKKLLHHLRYNRPKWYKKYHSYPIVHYVHFSLLILTVSFIGIVAASAFQQDDRRILGTSAISPNRTLSFQGRLTDTNNTPITSEKQVRFALYNSATESNSASASALLWEETELIQPDSDGFFATILGDGSAIPQSLFAQNPNVWLGVTIGGDPELIPRQQLATVPYATNTEFLQGLSPITQPGAGTKNVILALDSSGNLTIGGIATPVFQATGGELKLTGKSLVLGTNVGSNTNVTLAPDGTGVIDIQKALVNTTNNNGGGVQISDRLAVIANDSSTATLIVNNNTTSGNIFVASSSGTAKLVLTNDGNLGLGTTSPNTKLTVAGDITPNGNNESDIGSSTKAWRTMYAYSVLPGTSTGTQGWWQRNNGSIAPGNISDDFLIGGIATSGATLRIAASGSITTAGSLTFSSNGTIQASSTSNTLTIGGSNTGNIFLLPNNSAGKVGINTSSPLANLDIRASANDTPVASFSGSTGLATLILDNSGAGDIFTASSSGLNRFVIKQGGNVGIGTTLPSFRLHAADNQSATASAMIENTNTGADADGLAIKLGYTEAGTTTNNFVTFLNGNGIIHGKINSTGSSGVAYTTSGTDFAEYFRKESADEAFEQGDLVCLGPSGGVTKCTREQGRTTIAGVISLYPGFIGGINKENDSSFVLVGLVGQVPIRVQDNTSLAPGDMLTFSNTPGVATKATARGMIIGKVLSYTPLSDTAFLLLSPGWHDPSVFLTETGDLNIATGTNSYKEYQSPFRELFAKMKRTGEFFETIATDALYATHATLESLEATRIAVSSLTVKDEIISPLAQVDRLRTNVISPLAQDSSIELALAPDALEVRSQQKNATASSVVARIDSYGNATFLGELSSQTINAQNASIAGVLRVKDLIAGENLTIASYSGELAYIEHLNSRFAKFSEGIIALGPSSVTDLSVGGFFSVGTQSNGLILADNTINVLNSSLEIQPLRQGPINIMGGLVSIDTQGNLTVAGTLAVGVLSPIPDSDLVVRLGPKTEGLDLSFIIQNNQEQPVFSVNHLGDVIASGSGSFTKLILNSSIANALSETQIQASGSAGVGTISARKTEVTILNPLVTKDSLVYITPKTETNNEVLYLLRQRPEESFTVGIQSPAQKDVPFNWLMVN